MQQQVGSHTEGIFFRLAGLLIKIIEKVGSFFSHLGLVYGTGFYSSMLDSEVQMASLRPGDAVLHIGCGPLPLTALALAQRGFEVTAVDFDPRAVALAERFLRRMGVTDSVEVQLADGAKVAADQYDAVWVSLHVISKQRVLRNLLSNLPSGSRLLYRNPRGTMSYLYPQVSPNFLAPGQQSQVGAVSLGKESVVIWKGKNEEASTMTGKECKSSSRCLTELEPDKAALIFSTPDRSLFPPLGLRRGKKVTVRCSHPLGGPLVVDVEGRRIALARNLARQISVSGEGTMSGNAASRR